MIKEYAGVGSRDTPKDIQNLMRQLATALEKVGYILRSGGANGADSAFESGVVNTDNKRIFLPYKGFNKNASTLYAEPSAVALGWAEKAHPYFKNIKSDFARKAHARNANQVLGLDCKSPCSFVICWTPDGAENTKECHSVEVTGGTRTAVVIAAINKIPVFNLARPDAIARLRAFVKQQSAIPRVDWVPDPSVITEIKKQKAEKKKSYKTSTPSP